MSQATRALVVIALAAGAAHAESKQTPSTVTRPWTGYIRTPGAARTTGTSNVASSKIVYLKRCATACTVHFDPVDDSRTGASSISYEGTRTLSAFSQPMQVWTEMLACVRETFAPFDIQIVDTKPLDNTTPQTRTSCLVSFV